MDYENGFKDLQDEFEKTYPMIKYKRNIEPNIHNISHSSSFNQLLNSCYKRTNWDLFYDDEYDILLRMCRRRQFSQSNCFGYLMRVYHNVMLKYPVITPEIELCDIINFIYTLKLKRKPSNGCVYINACQDGKFYVGFSSGDYLPLGVEATSDNMAKNRLLSHRQGGGMYSNFITMYPVISTLISFYGGYEDEDLITILMNKCVGNNVRGGKWASPFINPNYPNYSIDEIKEKLTNPSYNIELERDKKLGIVIINSYRYKCVCGGDFMNDIKSFKSHNKTKKHNKLIKSSSIIIILS